MVPFPASSTINIRSQPIRAKGYYVGTEPPAAALYLLYIVEMHSLHPSWMCVPGHRKSHDMYQIERLADWQWSLPMMAYLWQYTCEPNMVVVD